VTARRNEILYFNNASLHIFNCAADSCKNLAAHLTHKGAATAIVGESRAKVGGVRCAVEGWRGESGWPGKATKTALAIKGRCKDITTKCKQLN